MSVKPFFSDDMSTSSKPNKLLQSLALERKRRKLFQESLSEQNVGQQEEDESKDIEHRKDEYQKDEYQKSFKIRHEESKTVLPLHECTTWNIQTISFPYDTPTFNSIVNPRYSLLDSTSNLTSIISKFDPLSMHYKQWNYDQYVMKQEEHKIEHVNIVHWNEHCIVYPLLAKDGVCMVSGHVFDTVIGSDCNALQFTMPNKHRVCLSIEPTTEDIRMFIQDDNISNEKIVVPSGFCERFEMDGATSYIQVIPVKLQRPTKITLAIDSKKMDPSHWSSLTFDPSISIVNDNDQVTLVNREGKKTDAIVLDIVENDVYITSAYTKATFHTDVDIELDVIDVNVYSPRVMMESYVQELCSELGVEMDKSQIQMFVGFRMREWIHMLENTNHILFDSDCISTYFKRYIKNDDVPQAIVNMFKELYVSKVDIHNHSFSSFWFFEACNIVSMFKCVSKYHIDMEPLTTFNITTPVAECIVQEHVSSIDYSILTKSKQFLNKFEGSKKELIRLENKYGADWVYGTRAESRDVSKHRDYDFMHNIHVEPIHIEEWVWDRLSEQSKLYRIRACVYSDLVIGV